MQEERVLHEAKLAKMEAEMKMVFQQKVQEKEAKLKQSEEELYARHKEMKDALEKQRADLEDKKRKIESGRPLTPEKSSVSIFLLNTSMCSDPLYADHQEEGVPPHVRFHRFRVREDEAKSYPSTCDTDIDDPVAIALLYMFSLYTISLNYLCLLTRYLGSCEYSSLFSWISPLLLHHV